MNILVTGSSGWLGQNLVPRLKKGSHDVVGLDPVLGPHTDIVGSVADRATARAAIRAHAIQAIVHSSALYKRHVRGDGRCSTISTASTIRPRR